MTLRINGASPIHDAYPDVQGPPVLVEPRPEAMRSPAIPAKVSPAYEMRVGRNWISQEGLNWWMSFFASPSQLYTSVSVTFFHPEENAWVSGSAYMWRPSLGQETFGTCNFANFSVLFTGLEWM